MNTRLTIVSKQIGVSTFCLKKLSKSSFDNKNICYNISLHWTANPQFQHSPSLITFVPVYIYIYILYMFSFTIKHINKSKILVIISFLFKFSFTYINEVFACFRCKIHSEELLVGLAVWYYTKEIENKQLSLLQPKLYSIN